MSIWSGNYFFISFDPYKKNPKLQISITNVQNKMFGILIFRNWNF